MRAGPAAAAGAVNASARATNPRRWKMTTKNARLSAERVGRDARRPDARGTRGCIRGAPEGASRSGHRTAQPLPEGARLRGALGAATGRLAPAPEPARRRARLRARQRLGAPGPAVGDGGDV